MEENKVTMTLFENLSIHLPLAYKKVTIAELYNLILSFTKKKWKIILADTHIFKD